MSNVKNVLRRFVGEESGATMVEYGIMVALVAVIAIGAVATLGGKVNTTFGTVNGALP